MKKIIHLLFSAIFLFFSAQLHAGIIYVTQNGAGAKDGSSWDNALDAAQLKYAMDTASAGTDFWIAQGTYYPTGTTDRTISFNLNAGIHLYGGFAGTESYLWDRNPTLNTTTLSGDIDHSGTTNVNDAYHVVSSYGFSSDNPILDGFTIEHGSADSYSNGYNYVGGGMVSQYLSPVINNCRFINNYATYSGGGLAYTAGNPVVSNCYFSNNSCSLLGGALGIEAYSYSSRIVNCVFVNNATGSNYGIGSAISVQSQSNGNVVNCSFSNNSYGGGVIEVSTGGINVVNCIVWNNNSTNSVAGNATVSYSDIQRGWTGAGSNNIDINPSFSNANLELSSCSHAIDAGTGTDAPVSDFLGADRPYGAAVDMGAYEYVGSISGIPPTPNITANTQILTCTAGTAGGVTLTSDNAAGNQWYLNGISINGATSQTYNPTTAGNYTVAIASGNCVSDFSAPVTLTYAPAPGDPSVFGDNVWNVYAWNAGGASDNGTSWNTNYAGYYVETAVGFDTKTKWASLLSPSSATGYQGCAVQPDNHSWSAKRKGFPCGHYIINIPGHDDAAQLFIDGNQVWEHNGCCDAHNNVWEGNLTSNSTVEYRVTEGGGESYGLISFAFTASPPVPVISSIKTTSCDGSDILLTSSSDTANQWYLDGMPIPGAMASTYSAGTSGIYTVQVAGYCPAVSSPVTITIGIPGNPSEFGNNVWNVYAFNAGNGTFGNGEWSSNYAGYYVDTALQFDTRNKWNENYSPSAAPGFSVCGSVSPDNHSWTAKRKGFPCGHYTLNIPGHDDAAQLLVNGIKVWEHNGCCDPHSSVWEGDLDYNSTVEFRTTEGGGLSYGALSFVRGAYAIAGVKFICGPTGQTTLDAGVHKTYAWSTGEDTRTITVNNAGPYSVTVNDGGCQQTANTNIAVGSPLDSLSLTAVTSSSCPGSKLMLTANAYVNNGKINTTRTYYIDVNDLVNLPYACPPVQYGNSNYYNSAWGFTWTDAAGNGKITKVQVQFALGIEGNWNGATHGTKLNGTSGQFINTPYWQWCNNNPNFNPVISLNVDTSKYIKNGQNTFLIADDNLNGSGFSFGLRRWAELNGYFAKITVTYESDILFTWTPGNLTNQEITVYPTVPTDYTLTANYQGCVSTASYHAVVNPVPTITADGNTTICPGSSITLTASEGSNHLWSNGATTRSIIASAAGDYFVTVDNCISSQPLTVIYKPAPFISASGPTTFCPGYGIDLTANDAVSWAWNTGAATQSIHVTDAGNYSVQVTDIDGCTQTVSQQIIVQPLVAPVLENYSGTKLCDNAPGYVDFYVSNFDYVSTYYANSDSVQDYHNGYFSSAYPGAYTVTVKDPLGCVSGPSDPIVVTGAPGNPDDFGNNAWNVYAFDNGASYWGFNVPWTQYVPDIYNYGIGSINAYYGYYEDTTLSFNTQNKWSPGGVPADASNFQGCGMPNSYGWIFSWSAKRKGFPCGNYQINVLNHDDEAELWVNGLNVWSEGGATGDAINNVWQGVLGPNSTVVFRVNNGGGPGFGAIDLVLIDNNVIAKPTISPAGPITICSNSSVTLTSSAATGNVWSNGATTQSINVNTAGNYYVTVSNAAGCSAQSDAVSVTVTTIITWYRDADNDGYGNPNVSVQACAKPTGYVSNNTDCNDNNASVYPKPWYRDADADGYGNPGVTVQACTKPTGYVANKQDCDDTKATVRPGATEICDGIDNDCDGLTDEGFTKTAYYKDVDGDSYGDPNTLLRSCSKPAGYVTNKRDCNDADAAIHPGAIDICDGVDNDCDGVTDEDCRSISITDASVTEGNTGQKNLRFTFSLNKVYAKQSITVNYTTQNVTATAGTDYVAKSGSVTFAPGAKQAYVNIVIKGDKLVEPTETFKVVLSNPVNAIISDGEATGTIINDDGAAIAAESIATPLASSATFVRLAPNPAFNTVKVLLQGYSGIVTINIMSLEGKQLLQRKVQTASAKLPQESIDVSRLAAGVYMVNIIDEHGSIKTERLVIQR